jgi:hypothetical protein
MAGQNSKLKYHCVEIVGQADCCAAARGLAGQRLLSDRAPLLPLADCDRAPDCGCIYRHHDDRRAGPRRQAAATDWQGKRMWKGAERRVGRGRREADWD